MIGAEDSPFYISIVCQHTEFCVNIWRLFARDEDDDEYDEDEHNIVEQIQQLQRQLKESREELERANNAHSTSNEQCKQAFGKLSDMLVSQRGCVAIRRRLLLS